MNIKQLGVGDLFQEAIGYAEQLVKLCNGMHGVDCRTPGVLFQELQGRLGCLPLASGAYGYFKNYVADAERQFKRGQANVARWELVQVVRRLRRLLNDWADGADAQASMLPPSGAPSQSAVPSPRHGTGQSTGNGRITPMRRPG